MKILLAASLMLGLTAAWQPAGNYEHVELPEAGGPWRPVYSLVDATLQSRLEARIAGNARWRALARDKRLAIAVIDLGTEPPRFARVNGNQMMYSASLPKIAVLLAAYAAIEDGELEETAQVRKDLGAMIRRSDNHAATRLIDLVGMPRIQSVLTDPRYQLYDEDRGGGLWVGKRYASKGKRVGDPLHGISHGATATQVARFYYLLVNGRLISPERSEQMLADLVDPGLNHKFVSAIREREPRARMYRKSGTWRNYHSDSVLVRGPVWRNYILVAMTESEDGDAIMSDLVPVIEALITEAPEQ